MSHHHELGICVLCGKVYPDRCPITVWFDTKEMRDRPVCIDKDVCETRQKEKEANDANDSISK